MNPETETDEPLMTLALTPAEHDAVRDLFEAFAFGADGETGRLLNEVYDRLVGDAPLEPVIDGRVVGLMECSLHGEPAREVYMGDDEPIIQVCTGGTGANRTWRTVDA